MVSKTLPHWRFQGLLTLFPKFFSTFLHSTCLLSVSGKYLALGEIHLPICTVLSNSTTLQAVTWIVDHPICNTGLSPSLALFSNRLSTKRSPSVQLIHYILEMMFTTTQFSIELILFHSQLLKESLLLSFPQSELAARNGFSLTLNDCPLPSHHLGFERFQPVSSLFRWALPRPFGPAAPSPQLGVPQPW